MEYWSWWIGALALGLFAVIFSFMTGKPLGVSGSWLSIARRRDDAKLRESAEAFAGNQQEINDDLMAMTMAEFGDDVVAENPQRRSGEANATFDPAATPKRQDYTPWTVHAVFLVTMFLGSYLASIYTGGFTLDMHLSPIHAKIFQNPGESWLSLLFGGMMVGFGTQMAGGCTSGHGLSGCAQLIPASMFSTFVFFGSGTLLTLLMNSLT